MPVLYSSLADYEKPKKAVQYAAVCIINARKPENTSGKRIPHWFDLPTDLDRIVEEFPTNMPSDITMDYTRTYAQFREDVYNLPFPYASRVITLYTPMSPMVHHLWVVTMIGAVLVTVNTAYKIHEVSTCSVNGYPYPGRQTDTSSDYVKS